MRIAHLSRYYLPHPGGIQRAMHELARACVAHGDEVRAIVSAEGPRSWRRTIDAVDIIGVPSYGELQGVPIAPGFVALRLSAGEVLHLHEAFPLGTLAALLRTGAPIVVSWHMDVVRQRTLRPLHSALATRLLRRATIHVASQSVADRSPVLRRFRERVRVIPHIVDVGRFARDEAHPLARRMRAWADGDAVAIFVGRFVYYKGLDVLLGALARTPALRLALVGDGPLAALLRAHARDLGLEARLLWLGAIDDQALVGAYSGADLLVLPSTLPVEAFGLVQVEAMAAGLPVVSTRLGTGVDEINRDGETGLLAPPSDVASLADALGSLARNAGLRRRLGASGLARAREFAPDALIDRYRALYAEVRA